MIEGKEGGRDATSDLLVTIHNYFTPFLRFHSRKNPVLSSYNKVILSMSYVFPSIFHYFVNNEPFIWSAVKN